MRYIVVPEWQGSPSSRAMQLIDGAEAIRGDLPASRTEVIAVPLEAGSSLDTGIQRASSIQMVREAVSLALERSDEPALVIGGDCGVALGPIDRASKSKGTDLAVVWFDAHGDLHTPDTSPSGAFGGMALRAVMGDGAWPLTATHPVAEERIVLAGARAFDDAEAAYLEKSAVTALTVDQTTSERVVSAVAASGAHAIYVHVDLDVLDPASIAGVTAAEPFGVELPVLLQTLTALKERFELVGAGISGFAPASSDRAGDDLGTILRIIGALAR